jgi:hypothetical protein
MTMIVIDDTMMLMMMMIIRTLQGNGKVGELRSQGSDRSGLRIQQQRTYTRWDHG